MTVPRRSEPEPSVVLEVPRPGVAVLTLNRPNRLNAIDRPMLEGLYAALSEIETDPATRVVILTGAGRGFCAGLDLGSDPIVPTHRHLDRMEAATASHHLWWRHLSPRLVRLPVPVIAAINGPAAGAGVVAALACDLRVASTSASFHNGFLDAGLSGCELGLSWLLPRVVGQTHAADFALRGRAIDARKAETIGLVSEVVPDDRLLSHALAVAEEILLRPPHNMWMTKQALWAGLEASSLESAVTLEAISQVNVMFTDDAEEQRRAGAERRAPSYGER